MVVVWWDVVGSHVEGAHESHALILSHGMFEKAEYGKGLNNTPSLLNGHDYVVMVTTRLTRISKLLLSCN